MQSTNEKPCQLCGQRDLKIFEIPNQIRLWHCARCELYQYGRPASENAYSMQYHQGYSENRHQKIRTAIYRLNRAASLLKTPAVRMLDVGCSVGCTVEAAQMRGWNAVGVDVSRDAVDYCKAKGLDCKMVDATQLPFDDDSFELVVSWHVIEHVEDVMESLKEWRRILRPDGLLVLETPDASSPRVKKLGKEYKKFWAAEHTYTFTPNNLGKLIERAGFQIEKEPMVGSLRNLAVKMGAPMCGYAIGYHSYLQARRLLGIQKAFQIFARKNELPSESENNNQHSGIERAA